MKSARSIFAGLRRRARIGISVEGLGLVAVSMMLFAAVSYGLDRTLRLESSFRLFLLVSLIGFLARLIWMRWLRPIRVELNDEEIALAVERASPDVRQALISALHFDETLAAGQQRGESETMMRRVVDDVEQRIRDIQFHRAVRGGRIAKFASMLVLGLAAFGVWSAAAPAEAGLWARRNLLLSSEEWPRETQLSFVGVEPGEVPRIAERDDYRVRVLAEGVIPDEIELLCEFEGGDESVRKLDRTGENEFALTLESLLEGVTLTATGGDGLTEPPLRLEIVPRPQITEVVVSLRYPDYMDREVEVLGAVGDVRVPQGSTLSLRAVSNKPLASARLDFDQTEKVDAKLSADGLTATADYAPTESGILRIDVLDRDDYGPVDPPQIYVRVVEDLAPDIDFRPEGVGTLIVANARIPGTLKLRDDYGLATVDAVYRTVSATPPAEGEERVEPPFAAAAVRGLDQLPEGETDAELDVVFDLEPLMQYDDPDSEKNPIRPGQMLSLRFDSLDNHAPEPHQGSSEVLNFRVVTVEKLLQELQRRQGEQRRELERLLERQINARDELAEIISPSSGDERAVLARNRIRTVARRQVAFGKKSQGIGERYRRIVQEMANNRLFEPNVTRDLESKIVTPLITLSLDDFPLSAERTSAFGEAGEESVRQEALASYDIIIGTLKRVLAQMDKADTIAALVESLRVVMKKESEARRQVEGLRDAQGAGVLEPDGPGDDTNNKRDKNK